MFNSKNAPGTMFEIRSLSVPPGVKPSTEHIQVQVFEIRSVAATSTATTRNERRQ